MTREMIIEQLERHRQEFALDHGWNTSVLESLDAAIKVLKQEPCEDAISRQAVLDIDFKRIILTTAKPAETIEQKVKALPSVQLPQNIIRCKECRFYTNFQKGKPWNVSKKYCNRVVTIKTSPDDFCSFAKAKIV